MHADRVAARSKGPSTAPPHRLGGASTPSQPAPAAAGRGHSLAGISALPPQALPFAPAPAPTPDLPPPAASAAVPARPIQRAGGWKKWLAGAGAVLGTAGLIAGAVLASPGLAITGGAGLLLGGGYLAHQGYHAHRRRKELREASRAIRQGIGGRYEPNDTGRSAVLSRVLAEASEHLANPNVRLSPTTGRGELGFGLGPLNQRNYEVRVNPDEPSEGFGRDPAKTRSTVLHELTHVAVDQSYGVNLGRRRGEQPENVRSDEERNERDARNYERVEALRETLAQDEAIPRRERAFIAERLRYANSGANTVSEHDTVVNELLYYFHQKGIPEESETSQGITRLAHEAYLRRTT